MRRRYMIRAAKSLKMKLYSEVACVRFHQGNGETLSHLDIYWSR